MQRQRVSVRFRVYGVFTVNKTKQKINDSLFVVVLFLIASTVSLFYFLVFT